MRRFIAPLAAALVAMIPALALADPPAGGPHDCAKKCACATSAKGASADKEKEAKAPSKTASQEPSEFVKSIWTSP